MMSQELGKPKVEVGLVNPSPVDATADLLTDSIRTFGLTNLMSRLMKGEDREALKREYDYELVEDAISALENRI